MQTTFGANSLAAASGRTGSGLRSGALAAVGVSLLAAFAVTAEASNRFPGHNGQLDQGGFVYAMTNDTDDNEILVYRRDRSGRLHAVRGATVSTGGAGGGADAPVDPLGSQGALIHDDAHDVLFAVNAGSDSVTAFSTAFLGLPLRWGRTVAPSGGHIPVSLAVLEDKLFVLNAGGTGAVATFEIGKHGGLELLDSFDLGLAAQAMFNQVMAPGQVGVDGLGRQLIVTYGGGSAVLTIALDDDGLPVGPVVSAPSPGIVPFAFGVTPYGSVLVAEAGSGSVSSYDPPSGNSPLNLVEAALATGQTATCWIAVHPSGFAYVSNTGSDTLSLYGYTRTSGLVLLDDIAAQTGGAPTDLTLAGSGRYLYSLDAAAGQISGFAVDADTGALGAVETESGLPASAGIQGIAARDY